MTRTTTRCSERPAAGGFEDGRDDNGSGAGFASREAHWYDEPLSGIRPANCAYTNATRIWPTATTGNSQIPTGPEFRSTSSYVPKTPIATETDANEIANIWKEFSVLFSSGS